MKIPFGISTTIAGGVIIVGSGLGVYAHNKSIPKETSVAIITASPEILPTSSPVIEIQGNIVAPPTPTPAQIPTATPEVKRLASSPSILPSETPLPTPTPIVYTQYNGTLYSYESPENSDRGGKKDGSSFVVNGKSYVVIKTGELKGKTLEKFITNDGQYPEKMEGMEKIAVKDFEAYQVQGRLTVYLAVNGAVYILQAREVANNTYPSSDVNDEVFKMFVHTFSLTE